VRIFCHRHLELSVALSVVARSRKPALVIIDDRYASSLIVSHSFGFTGEIVMNIQRYILMMKLRDMTNENSFWSVCRLVFHNES